ncbi:MAG: hypothetical protein JHC40_18705 [Burkholderiales bacterium]|nr:hypothetical protein [Burkholderiales bacterium]
MTEEAKPDEAKPDEAKPGEAKPGELPNYRHVRWMKHFDEIDREIAQLASVCKISILDPGVIERVLHKDTLVCGTQNPRAFEKLRSLLMMHYSVRDKAVVALGEKETMLILGEIVGRLRSRYGDRLGGPAA